MQINNLQLRQTAEQNLRNYSERNLQKSVILKCSASLSSDLDESVNCNMQIGCRQDRIIPFNCLSRCIRQYRPITQISALNKHGSAYSENNDTDYGTTEKKKNCHKLIFYSKDVMILDLQPDEQRVPYT